MNGNSRPSSNCLEQELNFRRHKSSVNDADILVLFPHAGGSASVFHSYIEELTTEWEVIVIQYPGREWRYRSPLKTSLYDYADEIVISLNALDVEIGRMIFFGHSMGAKIAYEVACRLTETPKLLIASCSPAPDVAPSHSLASGCPSKDLIAYLKKLGGTVSDVLDNDELMEIILPVIQSDFQCLESYLSSVVKIPLNSPIIGLSANKDMAVSSDLVRSWSSWTNKHFFLKVVNGGHFYFHEESPHIFKDNINSMLEMLIVADS